MPTKTRKHFYAINRGRCRPSIMCSWHDASPMVTGYPEADHKGFNTFSKAREWLSTRGHKQFYFCQGPSDGDKSVVDEHGGHPGFYVATDGQNAAIFENYSEVKLYVDGCKNSTQKAYADLKAAKAVLQQLKHLGRGFDAGKVDSRGVSDQDEGELVAGMANVSL